MCSDLLAAISFPFDLTCCECGRGLKYDSSHGMYFEFDVGLK